MSKFTMPFADVPRRLALGYRTTWDLRASGRLAVERRGGRLYVDPLDVERIAAEREAREAARRASRIAREVARG